jgi:hypothetical protein
VRSGVAFQTKVGRVEMESFCNISQVEYLFVALAKRNMCTAFFFLCFLYIGRGVAFCQFSASHGGCVFASLSAIGAPGFTRKGDHITCPWTFANSVSILHLINDVLEIIVFFFTFYGKGHCARSAFSRSGVDRFRNRQSHFQVCKTLTVCLD